MQLAPEIIATIAVAAITALVNILQILQRRGESQRQAETAEEGVLHGGYASLVEGMQKRLDQETRRLDATYTRIETLSQELTKLREEYASNAVAWKREKAELEARIIELECQRRDQAKRIVELEHEVRRLEAEKADIGARLSSMEAG